MTTTNSFKDILSFGQQHNSSTSLLTNNHYHHKHSDSTNHDDDNSEWKTVTKGIKRDKSGAPSFIQAEKNKSEILARNAYFVPRELEKGIYHNSGISAHFLCKSLKKNDNLRCYKRNQRRNRKRALLRAEREKEEVNKLKKDESHSVTTSISEPKRSILEVQDIWTNVILPFLNPKDIISFGCCSKESKRLSETGHLWEPLYHSKFPSSNIIPVSPSEWKLAYKLSTTNVLERLRCFHTKKTFLEAVVGVGVDFTVNPKTEQVDYISTSQDLFSASSFNDINIKTDVFGNKFQLFLPLYFSEEHFQRSLPLIKKTIVRLCPHRKMTRFCPSMVLDVLPKIINTFVVLVSDEGLAASRKSFHGIMRIHRLFIALAHEYPEIRNEALNKLRKFSLAEEHRLKSACPSLGNFIPLLMIIDQKTFQWSNIAQAYISESLDRNVLWVCKAHPKLESLHDTCPDERLKLTLEGAIVGMRLNMLSVYFQWIFCQGSMQERASMYDRFSGSVEAEENVLATNPKTPTQASNDEGVAATTPEVTKKCGTASSSSRVSYQRFRYNIHCILSVKLWQEYYKYLLVPCPPSKGAMAQLLKNAVRNSARKKYHKKGMNFSAVHASGTSKILSKGQRYSASGTLSRVQFRDHWTFDQRVYLDATCLLYAGKKLVSTVDFNHTNFQGGAVVHSGDVMTMNDGTHTINLDLQALDPSITSCVFVLSAYAQATLVDIKSASVSFRDADARPDAAPLCIYDLESHDKIPHLKSVIMCKLYRTNSAKGWHVLSIGDSHKGSADNYGPIYNAVQKLL